MASSEKMSSMSLRETLSVISSNIVTGGQTEAQAYVVGYVVKRKRSKIPTGPEDKKVLVNKVTYTVLSPDHRSTVLVDHFSPPVSEKIDHEDVPLPDTEKLIPVCRDTVNGEISVIPVTAIRYRAIALY
jgi:hypothetical protein